MKQPIKKASPDLKGLGDMLLIRRGTRGIRSVADEIKISAATLSRIERGYTADVETLKKVCDWLGINLGTVLGASEAPSQVKKNQPVALVHFRKEQSIAPNTAQALAQLILAAQQKLATD